nr:hypothetical protein T27F7.3 - Caenorhabditis elegans [Caenorhabditis elegans]
MSIANLNRPADAFEQLETEDGVRQGVCHIRIQQRTGRKTITTVQGIGTEYDLKRIVQYLKKVLRMRTTLRLLAKLVVFRCISVYLVASWFVPDEVYQSAEVAHHLVYGTGHLSWEWRHSLRSFFHPALIAFNVVQGGSALFGVHPWYWYIVSGIPAVLTVQMIPIIVGLLGPNIFRPSLLPFFATITYIIVHSLLPHKEQRFLLPIIPLLCIYAGGAFQNLKKWRGSAMAVMIAINIGIALFTSRYHQKHSCNGTIVEHPEYGEVIQLTGDQRDKVKDFLIKV